MFNIEGLSFENACLEKKYISVARRRIDYFIDFYSCSISGTQVHIDIYH